jgi:UDP-N-acetylglucosamine 2-epimerase (non-hydrolysing)
MNKKRIMFVFGTRPEAIKMAPVITEMAKYPDMLEPVIVSTGQHRQMLDQVLRIFSVEPDFDLEIMEPNQSLTRIMTKALTGLEELLAREKPDMLLVQGDTSTAFAAGLIAYYYKVPLGHVEAGLRTFDKWQPFPEEINRRLISVLADLNFAPTAISAANLAAEGVARNTIYLTGNTVIDALLTTAARKFDLRRLGLELPADRKIVLVTTHRRENFGQPMKNACQAIARLARDNARAVSFVVPVHKNPAVKAVVEETLADIPNVKLIEPLDYEPFIHLMKESYLILTDSGGVQEEAPSLGKPVLVMRDKTERPEAVTAGTVKLVGTDQETIYREIDKLLKDRQAYERMSQAVNPYGDGKAAGRIVQAILYHFGVVDRKPEEFKVKA